MLLTDFVGAAELVVLVDNEPMRLTGMGGLTAHGMEFEQHNSIDLDEVGVRVWSIIEDCDETFWAEPSKRALAPAA
jgi:hypothetical protein